MGICRWPAAILPPRITFETGPLKIAVELDDHSRFLTLATTDGGDGYWGDWTMFGDPRLELTTAQQNNRDER